MIDFYRYESKTASDFYTFYIVENPTKHKILMYCAMEIRFISIQH
jgi:hypothetical protein